MRALATAFAARHVALNFPIESLAVAETLSHGNESADPPIDMAAYVGEVALRTASGGCWVAEPAGAIIRFDIWMWNPLELVQAVRTGRSVPLVEAVLKIAEFGSNPTRRAAKRLRFHPRSTVDGHAVYALPARFDPD